MRAFVAMLRRKPGYVLFAAAAAFTLIFAALGFMKYARFLYNGIDLAYFNQVFWNSLHGSFFSQTIHPHLSLGDHLELAIPLLLPFYALWPDPRMLIILQAAALAACAWPLRELAKTRLKFHAGAAMLPLFAALAFLLHPSVQHIALYEFHILPFALLPLFFAALAYERGQFWRFLGFASLATLVREDVALVVFMFGALAWLEKKSWKWRLAPAVLAATYFFLAMTIIGSFAPGGGYKFLIYYSWLGDSPLDIIVGAVTHPLDVLAHIMSLGNLEMLIAFLMPLAFLPLLAPRRLVLLLGPLAQILLGAPGGGSLVTETHYAALFLPGLFLAAIDGTTLWPRIVDAVRRVGAPDPKKIAAVLAVTMAAYSTLTLGPLVPGACTALRISKCPGIPADISRNLVRANDATVAIKKIPVDAPVAASYALLPHLSSRERLYSLHYIFLGVTQFAQAPYDAPRDIRFVALDAYDLSLYRSQFLSTAWATPYYEGGNERLDAVVGITAAQHGDFTIFKKEEGAPAATIQPPDEASTRGVLILDALGTIRLVH